MNYKGLLVVVMIFLFVFSVSADEDYYTVLGVSQNATDAQIKAAYRKLAKQHHPDMQNGKSEDNEKKMAHINNAYETLSNKEKRKAYDEIYMFSNLFDDETINLIVEVLMGVGSLIVILVGLVIFFASLSCCLATCLCCACCCSGKRKAKFD